MPNTPRRVRSTHLPERRSNLIQAYPTHPFASVPSLITVPRSGSLLFSNTREPGRMRALFDSPDGGNPNCFLSIVSPFLPLVKKTRTDHIHSPPEKPPISAHPAPDSNRAH